MMQKGYSDTKQRMLMLLILLFPFMSAAFAQGVKINIEAPQSVMTGEQFRVNYIVESSTEVNEPVIIKNMEGFKILYGPSVSNSASVTFKEGKRSTVYRSTSTYYLEAEHEGNFTIPKAEIAVGGKKYKSDTHKIEVRSTEKMTEDIDAFVKTIVSKPRMNVSDTLTLTYRLYTTREINRIRRADFPYIRDFFFDNITRPRQHFVEEEVDGRVYKVVDLRVLILQPRKEGKLIIPEGEISVEYVTPTGKRLRDIWGDIYDETIRTEKTLKIDGVEVNVYDYKEV